MRAFLAFSTYSTHLICDHVSLAWSRRAQAKATQRHCIKHMCASSIEQSHTRQWLFTENRPTQQAQCAILMTRRGAMVLNKDARGTRDTFDSFFGSFHRKMISVCFVFASSQQDDGVVGWIFIIEAGHAACSCTLNLMLLKLLLARGFLLKQTLTMWTQRSVMWPHF